MEEKLFIYRRPNHLSFSELIRADGILCDVTIVANEQRFNVHRSFLAATVPFFRGMFTSDCREQKDGVVVLNNIEAKNVEPLLTFAYTGEIELNAKNAQSLMFDADFLGLTDLADECAKFLESCISPENVWAIKESAEMLKNDVLREKCSNYICRNFNRVSMTKQFLQIPIDDLEKIIKSQRLQVESEQCVYTAVMQWLKHSVDERKKYLPLLLKCVRLTNFTAEYLINDVLKDELISTSEECKDIVNAIIHFRIILKEQCTPNEVISRNCEPANSEPRIVLFIWELSLMFMYNPLTDSWGGCTTNRFGNGNFSISLLKGKLYALGIHTYWMTNRLAKRIAVFDSHTCRWKVIDKIKPKRNAFQMIGLGDYLFFLCGDVNSPTLVERYCPETAEWKTMAPMNSNHMYVQAVACRGCIYIYGRFQANLTESLLIECYNPSTDKWTIVNTSPKESRYRFEMAVLNNKIYICGGMDLDGHVLDSVMVYDPELNTCEYVASMKHPRYDLVVVAYHGKLWAIGGHSSYESLSYVEVYDPETNSWESRKSIPVTISFYMSGSVIPID